MSRRATELYSDVKDMLRRQAFSPEDLEHLRETFRDFIGSPRSTENIRSINDLLNVLEDRNCLSVERPGLLFKISDVIFQNADLYAALNQLSFETSPRVQILTSQILDELIVNRSGVEDPQLPPQVVHLICSEAGNDWTNIARGLSLPEGEIDSINISTGSLHDKAHKVLKAYMKNADPLTYRSSLLNALSLASRNDLREEVEHIFCRF